MASVWAFGYGLYRLYYAVGGTFGMLGTPVSQEDWRRINLIAAILLFATAFLPIVVARLWTRPRWQPLLLTLAWVIAIACISHALIGIVQRIASLAGALTISYPFWQVIDRREADLQALFFNEPWFLIEGLLWVALAWVGILRTSARRRWWVVSIVAAIAISTLVGLLSAFGVIGTWVAG